MISPSVSMIVLMLKQMFALINVEKTMEENQEKLKALGDSNINQRIQLASQKSKFLK